MAASFDSSSLRSAAVRSAFIGGFLTMSCASSQNGRETISDCRADGGTAKMSRYVHLMRSRFAESVIRAHPKSEIQRCRFPVVWNSPVAGLDPAHSDYLA